MAKITALQATNALTGAEFLPIVQGGVTKRASMSALRDQITPYLQNWYKGDTGNTGPANSTYLSRDALSKAPATNNSYTLVTAGGRVEYAFIKGDFTDLVDDVIIVRLLGVPVSEGALIITGSVPASAFGVATPNPDNGPAFGRMLAAARHLADGYAIPPRIILGSGSYRYSGLDVEGQPLNWAVQGLHLDAQPGVILIHTGSGVAMTFDGGQTGGGKGMIKITGGLVLRGNAQTTDGMYQRAIHHSTFDMEVQQVTRYGMRTEWAVCNEYWLRYSPVFRPAFSTACKAGVFLGRRNTGEHTSACTFHNPIFEGIDGYGISCQYAWQCTFIGGTSESNAGGIYVGPDSLFNTFIATDLEFNTALDLFCLGAYNKFISIYSDSACTYGGLANEIQGGNYNGVTAGGSLNEFNHIKYSNAGGAFTDGGTGTIKRSCFSILGGKLDPEQMHNPHDRIYFNRGDGAGAGMVTGAASNLIEGGRPADIADVVLLGGRRQIVTGNVVNVTAGPGTFGVLGHESAQVLLPAAGDAGLTEAIAQLLINFGFARR